MKINFIKINIESYLYALDMMFKNKTQKDVYMTYIMIIAGIFGFSYSLFWDSSFNEFETTRTNVINLETKITTDEQFLRSNPESKIVQLEQEISNINIRMLANRSNNTYIKSKIEEISSLVYDERTWGEYIDSISTNAQKYNVKIKSFSNVYAKKDSSFGHILDISISSTASFKNTLKFINSLEKSDLVVDIHDLNIQSTKKLTSDLNISVWGITY